MSNSTVPNKNPTPPSKMPVKRLIGGDGFRVPAFPPNFMHRKIGVVRDFPSNCGWPAVNKSLPDVSCPKPDPTNTSKVQCGAPARENSSPKFPPNCGLAAVKKVLPDVNCLKPDATNTSKVQCGAPARENSSSKFKRRKVDSVRDFPPNCGPSAWNKDLLEISKPKPDPMSTSKVVHFDSIDCENYQSNNVKCPEIDITPEKSGLNRSNGVIAIPAVPLRSLPPINLDHDENDDVIGRKVASNNENKAGLQKDRYSEKIEAMLDYGKELFKSVDMMYSTSENIKEVPVLVEGEEKTKSEDRILSRLILEKTASGLRIKLEENEEEISILSPEEWEMMKLPKNSSDGGKVSKVKQEIEPGRSGRNMEESRGIEILDPHCEDGENHRKRRYSDMMEEFESAQRLQEFTKGEHLAKSDPKWELVNLKNNVQHDHEQAIKVREVLDAFDKCYKEILKKPDQPGKGKGKRGTYAHLEAAKLLKEKGMSIETDNYRPFGHVAGVAIGDKFHFRAELVVIGLHRQHICGIDYTVVGGEIYATSVVDSGRYENKTKTNDILIYSGQGGNLKEATDQKLEKGNLALVNSMKMGYPVRVIYKITSCKKKGGKSNDNFQYMYNGIYRINRYWEERDLKNLKMVFKFELHRMPDQPRPHQTIGNSKKKLITSREVCVVDDVSNGNEKVKIHAMNGVDDERPLPFIYMTKMVYPEWFRPVYPVGCNCIKGCSHSKKCQCVLKNEGEFPYTEKGAIRSIMPLLHECGPRCKCPPSCINRVSQHGPQHQFEIFKTESRGWGVRSRDFITSGSFICEYVGELLQENEAVQKIGEDEYLFDISVDEDSIANEDGFVIDAAKCGNIGRFINHSCSPNIYTQEVLYDHDDKRMPHIMCFANNDICPLQELTYDYSYKLDRVCDANGNIKKKICLCGSRQCIGRMY